MLRKTPLLLALFAAALATAQPEQPRQRMMDAASFSRLETMGVTPPADWALGEPGKMQLKARTCPTNTSPTNLRRRIVDVATQEWGWFGFNVDDLHGQTLPVPSRNNQNANNNNNNVRRFLPLDPVEVAQVAHTIGGYWAAIPDASWIWARQNEAWQENGLAARWRDPWSAAFISWVMCESGINEQQQFERAIAHHSYIDQAIRARDNPQSRALFTAYQPGEQTINPGDLLCSGLRPMYRTLAERRAQLGVGARTHCDIVVEVNTQDQQILTIGGNVRSSVRMKVFPAAVEADGQLAPLPTNRYIFAHLKLRADAIAPDAIRNSPTLQTLGCMQTPTPASFTVAKLALSAASC
ncbi:MAG: DUF2272 domain-containing protein [Pseudomonadota bacterium]